MHPDRLETLARYNDERARGIVHTDEWALRMAAEKEALYAAEPWRDANYAVVNGLGYYVGWGDTPEEADRMAMAYYVRSAETSTVATAVALAVIVAILLFVSFA